MEIPLSANNSQFRAGLCSFVFKDGLITAPFSEQYLSACDLNAALCRLFSAVAQGLMSPKTAKTLAKSGLAN